MDPLTLIYLPDDDGMVTRIATWHQAEWGYLTGRSVALRVAEFAPQRNSRQVPLTRVALVDGEAVGNASLLTEDMDTHPDLTPWLASVYVQPAHRRRGIGSALCRAVMEDARRLGLPRVWLYTPSQAALYAALGWTHAGEENYHGEMVTLMHYDPAGGSGQGGDSA